MNPFGSQQSPASPQNGGGPFFRRGRYVALPATGFTLPEMLVVVIILAVLTALLVPGLNKARNSADAAACASHLRQINAGFNLYASEHDGLLPLIDFWGTTGGATPVMTMWHTEVAPYLGLRTDNNDRLNPVWSCPTVRRKVPPTGKIPDFCLNRDVSLTKDGYVSGVKLAMINAPAQKVVLFCTARRRSSLMLSWVQNYGPGVGWGNRMNPAGGDAGLSNFCEAHNERANVLYADGHVEPTAFSQVNDARYWLRER